MNNIKTEFTIKDLENFSGIKAHTIRIWERRYHLLSPNRTDSNIRFYSLNDLQKLLNINLLYLSGLKISKIAKLSPKELKLKVTELVFHKEIENHAIHSFKLAMLNFDEQLFNQTYNRLLASLSFQEVFNQVFIPLLNEIGLLWQVSSITPAHEHFVSNLIKQKIYNNIEKLQVSTYSKPNEWFVLFLPLNEIHEIGLLYLHFELNFRGHKSVYLGQSVPTQSLADLINLQNKITFVSYFTVEPSTDSISVFVADFHEKLLNNSENKLYLLGKKVIDLQLDVALQKSTISFKSVGDLLLNL